MPKNIGPAGDTSDVQEWWASLPHPMPKIHGRAHHIRCSRILGQLVRHQMFMNYGWAWGIRCPRFMGEPVPSDTQEYWTSWWDIRCPRVMGGLGASNPQDSWGSPSHQILKNTVPAPVTSHIQDLWVCSGIPNLAGDRCNGWTSLHDWRRGWTAHLTTANSMLSLQSYPRSYCSNHQRRGQPVISEFSKGQC